MAPIDFEKELKDRLHARELQPGEHTWDRLEARLEDAAPGRRRRPAGWLVLAAASIALLMGFIWFVESEKDQITEPGLPSPELVSPSEGTDMALPDSFEFPDADTGLATAPGQTVEAQQEATEEPISRRPTAPESQWAATGEPAVGTVNEDGLAVPEPDAFSRRETGLVTEATEMNTGISEQEIDSLLKRAQESIALQRQTDTISGVDATALLNRAEDELDQTFRDQILEKLKTGIDKVRTAVADRNK